MPPSLPVRQSLQTSPVRALLRSCTRRDVLAGVLGGALGAGLCKAHGASWAGGVEDSTPLSSDLLSSPVQVPHDFAGLHMHRWPVGEPPSPAPSFRFGAVRSHDFDGASWNRIHLAPNRFDWSVLDRWVDAHAAQRRTLLYTLYGTPAWAAERTDRPDLYGRPGGAAPPRDLDTVREFISALLHRYNGDGQRRIQLIETWNEPRFDGKEDSFWWGSASQLAAVGRTIYQTAKGADPAVRVLSPGFVGDLSGALNLRLPLLAAARRSPVCQYLTAADGSGGTGGLWCDAVAFHTYNVPMDGQNAGYVFGIRKLQAMLRLLERPLPLINTELGFTAEDPFHQLSPQQQGETLRRIAAMQAAAGVQAIFFYGFDDNYIGDPSRHPEIAAALEEVHDTLAGTTLLRARQMADGHVEIVTKERTVQW